MSADLDLRLATAYDARARLNIHNAIIVPLAGRPN
jgi:hypothetical protein